MTHNGSIRYQLKTERRINEITADLNQSILRMVDDDEQELLVGCHHNLVLLQPEPDEGEVVVGVLGPKSNRKFINLSLSLKNKSIFNSD